MDDRIIELLYRNLQGVFGEGDAVRRRTAIEDFYTEDCILVYTKWGCVARRSPANSSSASYVIIVRDGKIAALYVFLNPKFA